MANVLQLLILSLFGLCLRFVVAQRLPPNACSNIFRYERQGNHWIGHVTPNQNGLRDVNWKLRFSSHGSNIPGTVSNLAPYPDKATAVQRMHDGGSAETFVRFNNYDDELPKIVLIELNGQELCSASSYGAPSSTATRQLHLSVSSSTYTTHEVAQPKPQTQSSISEFIEGNRFGVTLPWPQNQLSISDFFEGNPFLSALNTRKPVTTRKPVVNVVTRQEPAAEECGVEGFTGLQIGGENVPRGRFPWMAALYHDTNVDPTRIELAYKCVSTLISGRTVITAAHCIYGMTAAQLRVYVGRHDVTLHPEKDATLMAVQSVKTHPDFVGNLVPDSDVGLLVLTEHVTYSTYVRPICLWTRSTSLGIDDNELATVAGWGTDSTFKPTRFPTSVNVRPVSREECLREMVTAKDFLTPRTLCAGNNQGHGPCLGDSGGGLMVLRNNRWMVRGIVSLAQRAGNGCDLSRYVIYCDVARHLSWIEKNVVR